MDILVGHTGFVGSNLLSSHKFDYVFNSKNIEQAYGLKPDLCVYAGVKAEKYLANAMPDVDLSDIRHATDNIEKIAPKKLVLISTIDIYDEPERADERTITIPKKLNAYGRNRSYLESWVKMSVEDYHIMRLPALFGKNIRKNFIYDMIYKIPSALSHKKFWEFAEREEIVAALYIAQDTGFYKCNCTNPLERRLLLEAFERLNFSALNFTDSRAKYQFYDLSLLWQHIEIAIKNEIKILNLAVEPLTASEVYRAVRGGEFKNEMSIDYIPVYDFRTRYDEIFDGENGYIMKKEEVLERIVNFFKRYEHEAISF